MPLPPVIRVTDTVPVYSPLDTAIDASAIPPMPKKPKKKGAKPKKPHPLTVFWQSYCKGEQLDVSKLPMVEGQKPTVFHIRGLSSREKDCAVSLTIGELTKESTPEEKKLATTAYLGMLVRFGLVRVENEPDGWDFDRVRRWGFALWPEEILDAIDPRTFAFLGNAIWSLSTVPLERSATSG